MKNIIIVGASAHAAEIVEYIEYINDYSIDAVYRIKGLIDKNEIHYKTYGFEYKFLGNTDNHIIDKNSYYIIGIGNMSVRKKVIDEFKFKGAKFETIIHPTALVSKTAEIGIGCLISHNVSVGPKAKIGEFCVINSRSTVGHDSVLGENNFISPQVVLGGSTKIGKNNLLGTNCCLVPKIVVGNNNKVMAGMIVTNNIKDDEIVFYRFKEKLIIRNNN